MKCISYEKISKFPELNENIFIDKKNNCLYKKTLISDTDINTLEYLTTVKVDGALFPEAIYDDASSIYYIYRMPYIRKSCNIEEFLRYDKHIDKIFVLKEIFKILQEIHKHIIIGDVRNANILLSKNNAYFCDFDYSKKNEGKPIQILSYYMPYYNYKNYYQSTILTDTIKAFISALSIYYNLNIEFLINGNLSTLLTVLTNASANNDILYYLRSLVSNLCNDEFKPEIDFLEILDILDPPSNKEMSRVARTFKLRGMVL